MLCQAIGRLGRSGFSVECSVICDRLESSRHWKMLLENSSNTIWFVDEDFLYSETDEFAKLIRDTNNYFVIVSRKSLSKIPYSYLEMYKIVNNKNKHFNTIERIYREQYENSFPELIITEDSKSGYQFFKAAVGDNVISAGGNSKICKTAEMNLDKELLIFADGAAIGNYVDSIVSLKTIYKNVRLFFPESFEYLLLKSNLFSYDKEIQEIFKEPANYITSEYLTWERFFTKLLINIMSSVRGREYTKAKLTKCFIEKCCTNKEVCIFYQNAADKFNLIMKDYDKIDFSRIRIKSNVT